MKFLTVPCSPESSMVSDVSDSAAFDSLSTLFMVKASGPRA